MNIYSPIPITQEIIDNFRPTRLYIKELYGVYYFGKTVINDIVSYTGSGKLWKDRIKKYSKEEIKTLWFSDWYTCPEEIQSVALHFSSENQIVESPIWANLKPENGFDGGAVPGAGAWTKTEEGRKRLSEIQNDPIRKKKASDRMSGENNIACRPDVRLKISLASKGVPKSEQHKKNMFKPMSDPEISSRRKGSANPVYDHSIYSFIHKNGSVEICTQRELIDKYHLNKGNVTTMINHPDKRPSVSGWSLLPNSQDN